ncbi:MAG: CsgG/HfaB family protein, partial [Candidatus Omnitrophota bacterium]
MFKNKIFVVLLVILVACGVTTDTFAAKKKKEKMPKSFEDLPPSEGPKKTIAVMEFENKAGISAQINLGEGMAEMLTTALLDSGRFIVVERQAITDVLAEQDFGASGRTTSQGAPQFGRVLPAQIMIRGAVTQFGLRESGGGGALSIKGIDVGLATSQAQVGVDIRIYDTTTGQVLDSVRCEGKVSATGLDFGYSESDWGFGTGVFQNTPLGKATAKAIDKAVIAIITRTKNVPWEGRVIKATSNEAYINAGANSGIEVGDTFSVYRLEEELIDPQTGMSLGSESER